MRNQGGDWRACVGVVTSRLDEPDHLPQNDPIALSVMRIRNMSGSTSGGQSGGINNPGTINTGGGNVVGGDLTITTTTYYSPTEIHGAWNPVAEAIRAA